MKIFIARFVTLMVMIFMLLLPSQTYANTEFGQLLSSVVKARVTLKTNKKKGVTIGKVKVTNKTRKKTGQPVYGGMTLVITSISNPTVTLKNFSGYTEDRHPYLLISHTSPLSPKKSIKGILLEFNNPDRKRFKFTYEIYGSLSPSQINNVSPNQASSGTEITLTGQNFTPASTVQVAGQNIRPKYISGSQLKFIAPFGIDEKNQLLPLEAGNHPIQIDGSSPFPFTVTELPNNPNPPGQVMAEHVSQIYRGLAQALPQFQALLPQLMDETINEPNTQKFIQLIANLANTLNNQGEATVTQLLTQIDPISLDTLERALNYAQQSSQNTGQQTKGATTQASTVKAASPLQTAGDQWLTDRQAFAQDAQLLSVITSLSGKCASIFSLSAFFQIANPTLAGACLIIGTSSALVQIIGEIEVTEDWRFGIAKKMQLNIYSFGPPDTVELKGLLQVREYIGLNINNADNNEVNPTPKAKNITGATLFISHKVDWARISNTLFSIVADVFKIKIWGNVYVDYVYLQLVEMLSIKIDAVKWTPKSGQ